MKGETFNQLLDLTQIQSNKNLHSLDENNDLDIKEIKMRERQTRPILKANE